MRLPVSTSAERSIRQLVTPVSAARRSSSARARSGAHWRAELSPVMMVMVGDTSHDLEMAQAAGAQAVGVTFGAHGRGELERFAALELFDSPAELHRWLLEIFPASG